MTQTARRSTSGVKANENAHLYSALPENREGAAVVSALQDLGDVARQAEDRAVIELGMSPGDVLATRYLLQAERDGQQLTPTDLATLLGVTTAAASKLVDRLVSAGRAERLPDPADKRARIVAPTAAARADIHATYALIHEPLVRVVNGLTASEASAVTRFLKTLSSALAVSPTAP